MENETPTPTSNAGIGLLIAVLGMVFVGLTLLAAMGPSLLARAESIGVLASCQDVNQCPCSTQPQLYSGDGYSQGQNPWNNNGAQQNNPSQTPCPNNKEQEQAPQPRDYPESLPDSKGIYDYRDAADAMHLC